jgi:hypothetical protein
MVEVLIGWLVTRAADHGAKLGEREPMIVFPGCRASGDLFVVRVDTHDETISAAPVTAARMPAAR